MKAKEHVTYVTRRELLTLIIIVLVAVISLAAWFSYFPETPSLKGPSATVLWAENLLGESIDAKSILATTSFWQSS